MTLFESLLLLLLAAIVLLQVARHLSLPYPSMLALAGVGVALLPGAPDFPIDPRTALPLFIAPALMDAAFDFPVTTARRFWVPLVIFALGGVLITALLVAWVGWAFAGLPIAAALVLGAIVAPPDAAAATAILSGMAIPRATDAILRGESLFNDAAALLLFSAALTAQMSGGLTAAQVGGFALAAPGGVLFGMVAAWLMPYMSRLVTGALDSNLLQFVNTFLVWIIAEHLHVSPVLAVVALAMTLASRTARPTSPRMRVQSYAVWNVVVFVLNVLAFLLMGLQARRIIGDMSGEHLRHALAFTGLVIAIVVVVRLVVALGFNRAVAWYRRRSGRAEPATWRQGTLAGWCGMRGLVTLATAFILPAEFPQRDTVVLAAFGVVLATLVVQGLTLAPMIRLLGLDHRAVTERELVAVRRGLARAALHRLEDEASEEGARLAALFRIEVDALDEPPRGDAHQRHCALSLAAIAAQRTELERCRLEFQLSDDDYNFLLEQLDWRELTVLPPEATRIGTA
ncbi:MULTISPECIES: cation:proton antiporter [Luteibacter]|uniref:cation:proton antiporter n=1 Tax=Luteibacter TaxID=242605 RepID=UPI000559F6D5|nr:MULTISPECIES: cation:proton antiporter [unclassified Luteibacter]